MLDPPVTERHRARWLSKGTVWQDCVLAWSGLKWHALSPLLSRTNIKPGAAAGAALSDLARRSSPGTASGRA
jgi:hypothetical protein